MILGGFIAVIDLGFVLLEMERRKKLQQRQGVS